MIKNSDVLKHFYSNIDFIIDRKNNEIKIMNALFENCDICLKLRGKKLRADHLVFRNSSNSGLMV